ncbi:MAG: SDR family NAD(P)-dependent oxidoreductase, partial [Anaerolineae bacterium]|nr:SDR family NAD(P)-dependent oxidoreductase [Anaerolineae bacterium]
MKHILVIGGTGRIARPVVRELVQSGYIVRVMARNPEKVRGLLPNEVEFFAGDLADMGQLAKAVAGMDAIYMNLPEVANPNVSFIPDRHGIQNILQVAPKNTLLMKLSQLGVYENPRYHNMTLKYRAEAML